MPYIGSAPSPIFDTDIALTSLTTTGNVSVGGTLGVTGATTLSNTLGVTGALTATGGGTV